MAGWGYQMELRKRSVGVGALQKSASQSGDATEVETLARSNGS